VTTSVRFGVMAYDYPASEMVEIAKLAEELGFDGFWVGEHLLWPVGYDGHHPTRDAQAEAAEPIIHGGSHLPDPWPVFGAVAQATGRILIGSAVYLAIARHPLATARSAASVVDLSGGRLLLGVGSGWLREEFEALGVPFHGRGAALDECLEILKAALNGGTLKHDGDRWSFPTVQVVPAPVHLPIIVGGNVPAAFRRAARIGDGWINSGYATLENVTRARDGIQAELAKVGRDGDGFRYWVRPAEFVPKESQRFAEAGFCDQIFPSDEMWPRGAQDLAEKQASMRRWAERFGMGVFGSAA
jgi:probable F420-dependent oxidoreductase